MDTPTVFLAGTCGGDPWRDRFITTLDAMGVSYFNPQVDDWQPWMVDRENHCLAHSPVVLFPVLSSTLGFGSLAEIGFSVLSVLRTLHQQPARSLLVTIAPDVDPQATIKEPQPDGSKRTVQASPGLIAESVRTRHLVATKLAQETWRPGVFLLPDLDSLHAQMITLLTARSVQSTQTG